jgi:sugar lactone lactonase YvrE
LERRPYRVLIDGALFPLSPCWHDGRLWLSDCIGGQVLAVDMLGRVERICSVRHFPSGIGFLPDGRLVVASMDGRRLLRLDSDALSLHTDLRDVAAGQLTDLAVDADGRIYVADLGYDFLFGEAARPGRLLCVEPGGEVRVAAEKLQHPCAIALSAEGRRLVAAEGDAKRLAWFDVSADGSLERRATVELGELSPEGICLDRDGAVWVAADHAGAFVRVLPDGHVGARIWVDPRRAVACAPGGPDRNTLFCATAESPLGAGGWTAQRVRARLELAELDVPGASAP